MESKKNYLPLTNEFVVRYDDINDSGTLSICKLLQEITSLYDQAVILAFGDLNYYRILTSSYHIDFLSHAQTGDLIKLESEATLHFGVSLEVDIIVRKKSNKNKTVAQGHFVFTLQNREQILPFSLS